MLCTLCEKAFVFVMVLVAAVANMASTAASLAEGNLWLFNINLTD